MKWNTETESVVFPCLNQGQKFLTKCYMIISKSHHGKYIRQGINWKLKIKRPGCVQWDLSVKFNSEIYHIVSTIHNRSISVRQVKYFCQKLKSTRRCHVQNNLVNYIITNELSTSRFCLGYRQSEFISIK